MFLVAFFLVCAFGFTDHSLSCVEFTDNSFDVNALSIDQNLLFHRAEALCQTNHIDELQHSAAVSFVKRAFSNSTVQAIVEFQLSTDQANFFRCVTEISDEIIEVSSAKQFVPKATINQTGRACPDGTLIYHQTIGEGRLLQTSSLGGEAGSYNCTADTMVRTAQLQSFSQNCFSSLFSGYFTGYTSITDITASSPDAEFRLVSQYFKNNYPLLTSAATAFSAGSKYIGADKSYKIIYVIPDAKFSPQFYLGVGVKRGLTVQPISLRKIWPI